MKHITDLFMEMVKISSPSSKEKEMSKYLQDWLKESGFNFKIDGVGNIYASNNKPGTPLLLCSHMDTVEPGSNIKPLVEKGIIKSSGDTILGADNKVATAAILYAVSSNNNRNLELLFTVKEETGGGVEFFPFEWIQSKIGLVFDSSNPLGGIVLRSPYISNFHILISGKTSHSSLPNAGVNAFVPAFTALPAIPLGSLDNNETTVNIGKILGGVGINTIPDKIQIQGEVRSYNKTYFEARIENIKNVFNTATHESGTTLQFQTDGYCSGYTHEKNHMAIKAISQIYEDLRLPVIYYSYSGVSDANVLNQHGITTLNLTDGSRFTHTVNEEIAVKDLETLSRIVSSCINNL